MAPRAYDFFELKGMIEAIFSALGVGLLTFTPADDAVFQPGRNARVRAGGQRASVAGCLAGAACAGGAPGPGTRAFPGGLAWARRRSGAANARG